jgi:hypothetical protein
MNNCVAKEVIKRYRDDAHERMQYAESIPDYASAGTFGAQVKMCESMLADIDIRLNASVEEAMQATYLQGGKHALKWLAILFIVAAVAIFGAGRILG